MPWIVRVVTWLSCMTFRHSLVCVSLWVSSSRANLPSCFSPSPCWGKASLGSSGSESTAAHEKSPGRWSAICWSIWSAKLRTNTGSAERTWRKSRSTATPQSAGPRTGSRSKKPNMLISLNINSSQIIWVIWISPRIGQISRDSECSMFVPKRSQCLFVFLLHPLVFIWTLSLQATTNICPSPRRRVLILY